MRALPCSAALAALAFALPACADFDEDEVGTASQPVWDGIVGGTYVPVADYPWVVDTDGCHGIPIHPRWILTAAHCDSPSISAPANAAPQDTQHPSVRRWVRHPDFDSTSADNDVALIELETPLAIDSHVQTVALPDRDPPVGTQARVASSVEHDGTAFTTPPQGSLAIYNGTVDLYIAGGTVFDGPPGLYLGDSGSGFVGLERPAAGSPRRAVVYGIAQRGSLTGTATFVNVFFYRQWILDTIGMSAQELRGNVRLAVDGSYGDGTMTLSCTNVAGQTVAASGPMDVEGVELGVSCVAAVGIEADCPVDAPGLELVEARVTTAGGTTSTVCRVNPRPAVLSAIL